MMGCSQLSERKGLLKKNSKLKVVPKKIHPVWWLRGVSRFGGRSIKHGGRLFNLMAAAVFN